MRKWFTISFSIFLVTFKTLASETTKWTFYSELNTIFNKNLDDLGVYNFPKLDQFPDKDWRAIPLEKFENNPGKLFKPNMANNLKLETGAIRKIGVNGAFFTGIAYTRLCGNGDWYKLRFSDMVDAERGFVLGTQFQPIQFYYRYHLIGFNVGYAISEKFKNSHFEHRLKFAFNASNTIMSDFRLEGILKNQNKYYYQKDLNYKDFATLFYPSVSYQAKILEQSHLQFWFNSGFNFSYIPTPKDYRQNTYSHYVKSNIYQFYFGILACWK
ncbi:MAG: hypothetical protein H6607_13425 [Flavobacteriales bacterium]|nr:hypothetical protein [Flavobacteriales bacterium]